MNFTKKEETYINHINDMLNKLEKRDQSWKQKTVCSDPIIQLSSKPVVLNMTDPTTKPFIYIAKIA